MKFKLYNKKYLSIIIIILIIIIIVLSIKCKNNTIKSVDINTKNNTISKKLKYEDYQILFKDIVENIKIPDLIVKANTLGNNVTIIDKELSFNKRKALTLTGEFNNTINPTDEQLTLENTSQSKQITIGIFYTKNFIGNDLVGWPNNKGYNKLNKRLVDNVNLTILTYKNLIITIQQDSIDKVDIDLNKQIIKSLIKILDKY